MNSKVDFYFDKPGRWQQEIALMRSIAQDCGLTEELKWGCPCYTVDGRNVVLIHVFKDYCAFLFFNGALLKDAKKILVQQSANVQAARQARFTDTATVERQSAILKTYIREAAALEKAGKRVVLKAVEEFEVVPEFQEYLDGAPDVKAAFAKLTPGRQRAYLLNFSSAKQSKTRIARIEKCIPAILAGKGLNDE